MATIPDSQGFVANFQKAFFAVPLHGWAAAAYVGMLAGLMTLGSWMGTTSPLMIWGAIGVQTLCSIVATFVVCMTSLHRPLSFDAGARFVVSFIGMVMPIGIPIAAAALFYTDQSSLLFAGLIGVSGLSGFVVLVLLQPWPLASAMAGQIVSPWRILAATKGLRWKLFIALVIICFVPEIGSDPRPSDTISKAAAVSMLNGLLATLGVVLGARISIAAWAHTARQDPSLGASRN